MCVSLFVSLVNVIVCVAHSTGTLRICVYLDARCLSVCVHMSAPVSVSVSVAVSVSMNVRTNTALSPKIQQK